METASLRIRFTPLLKKALQNESRCSLEIVPEVSCVQNLDKISWKHEDNLIEYTIPMTYKIILKKREIDEKNDDDSVVLEKTYHSCVDLLPPSSMTAIDFASGDITRNISDTYVLGKISVDDDKNETNNDFIKAIKAHVTNHRNDYLKEMRALQQIVENKTAVNVDNDERNIMHDDVILKPLNLSDTVLDKYSLDKITNTENNMTLSKVTETQSVETITEISTKSRDDSKRKLSLSPICSIDTYDNPFLNSFENVVPFNSAVQYAETDFIGDVANKYSNKHTIHIADIMMHGSVSVQNPLYRTHKRELPETRVAKFIKKMETEIMPLKMMLNDILIKCSRLGLNQTKFVARNLVLYKTVPGCKNQVEKYCKTENQTKSNRVVYSIVFDG